MTFLPKNSIATIAVARDKVCVRRNPLNLSKMTRFGIGKLRVNHSAHVPLWAMKPISYARHRFAPDVIRHAVWLYLRFAYRQGRKYRGSGR
jgi:hypothetical protein